MHIGPELWSPIREDLWMGGTYEVLLDGSRHAPNISLEFFDTVITLFADAPPVSAGVKEFRLGFEDQEILDVDLTSLSLLVQLAHNEWVSGNRVLIRCEGGWNRSGLVTALVLMKSGELAKDAVAELRSQRGALVLSNQAFESWLLTEAARLLWP
jgi:protein-tyrosine phosphatase